MISRRSLVAGGMALGVLAFARAAAVACKPRRVLFVCQYGSVKSPIARELTRRRAAERRLRIDVEARGISPEEHLSPELASALQADRINPKAEPLRKLAPEDLARADLVIVFDKLPADFKTRRVRDWSSLPSMNADYARSRADLAGRIDRLLNDLQAAKC